MDSPRSLPLILSALLMSVSTASAHQIQPSTPNPGLHHYYPVSKLENPEIIKVDVCVYGGTPGGVGAAIQAKRMGKTAALAVFRRHVGGMTSAGLTAVDLGKKDSIGGLSAEFLEKMGWTQFRTADAETTFRDMLAEAGVEVLFEHRLERVEKDGARITALVFENGQRIEAEMFIDATYEGDLFGRAGVSYHVGREANSVYNENWNGYFIADKHQFRFPVDPYRVPGDPSSGLLPGISDEPIREKGTGDNRIQAYNFRMWLTTAEEGTAFPKPDNYDRDTYALLLRYITTAPEGFEWDFKYRHGPIKMNIGDCNSAGPVSTDFIGGNYDWPEGDYATRERIFQEHITYQLGMVWFLANDPDVPEDIRAFVNKFGLPKDQFEETGGWPHELYVREGRRMISDYVMTEANCMGRESVEDSVGLASYTMDSHHTSRVVVDGVVMAEGNVEIPVPQPYPVSYRSIRPRREECTNLLVPVGLSASHIAFGSIRMEPVFMLLGQSAATAAVIAIDEGIDVQDVDYQKLRDQLLKDGQILDWNPPAPKSE